MHGRLSRTILLGCSVALASALVSAVGTGMNSMHASVEYRIDKVIGAASVRVVHENGTRFDRELVHSLTDLPGVEMGGGRLGGSLTLVRTDNGIDKDGRLRRVTANARGIDLDPLDRFNQIEIAHGRHVREPGEIVLDPIAAQSLRIDIGEMVRVQRFGSSIDLEVVGIQRRPVLGGLQRPRVQLARETLAEAVGAGDRIDVYSIVLDDNLDVEAWVAQHANAVEPPLILEPTERIRSGLDRQVRSGRIAFILAVMIGFLACSIIVATGMTTALAEQQRDMAIMRLIGASRFQLFSAQLIIGVLICVSGGLIGIPIGLGIAWVIATWYSDFLPAGFHPSFAAAVLSLLGAGVAGVIGALLPAWLASRVSPISALAVQAQPPRGSGVLWCTMIGAALILMQVGLLFVPDVQMRFWLYVIVGIPLIISGFFLLTPGLAWILIPPMGTVAEWVLRLPRGILRGSMRAAPYRLGLTAGALMVGMAILTSTWSNGKSLLENIVDRVRFADAFVFNTTGLTQEQQERIARLPGVAAASPVGYLPIRVGSDVQLGVQMLAPRNVVCVGFEVESFLELNRVEWIRGTPEEAVPQLLEGNAILVAEQFLTARHLDVGDSVSLGPPGREKTFEIVGVVSAAGLDVATQIFGIRSLYMEHAASCVFMDFDAVTRHFNAREAYIMQIVLDPGMDEIDEHALGVNVTNAVPGARFNSGRSIKKMITMAGTTILGVSSSVAFAALLLACFSVGSVVAAGISARKYEFGVLRAIGSPRWMLVRIVLGEVIVMAILAVIAGVWMGLHLAWVGTTLYRDLGGIVLQWIIPVTPIAIGGAVLILLTLLAALPPIISLLLRPTRELLAVGR